MDAPAHYPALLAPLPAGASVVDDPQGADIVHAFVANRADLARRIEGLVNRPRVGGALWISWPKKSSKLFTDLTENGVRALVLPTGWVDVKVCAVDEDWSALRFLRRRAVPGPSC